MNNGLALLARWSVRQKLNRVSSVQLRHSVRTCDADATHLDILSRVFVAGENNKYKPHSSAYTVWTQLE